MLLLQKDSLLSTQMITRVNAMFSVLLLCQPVVLNLIVSRMTQEMIHHTSKDVSVQ